MSQHIPPLFRKTDPATSRLAAAEIVPKLGELQARAVEAVRATPGLTRNELADRHGWEPAEISKRLTECDRLGRVRRGEARSCTRSNRSAATWWPVES